MFVKKLQGVVAVVIILAFHGGGGRALKLQKEGTEHRRN